MSKKEKNAIANQFAVFIDECFLEKRSIEISILKSKFQIEHPENYKRFNNTFQGFLSNTTKFAKFGTKLKATVKNETIEQFKKRNIRGENKIFPLQNQKTPH